ncbi:hypothetical protein U9M48_015522 [Paspalum notatum var. saurae]|uniref:Uncharacterized protein n=1 Tax=Paspalum notatum var. saurae TaxID=547442 RepID=A0AAQ3T3B1_PASNO
MAGTSSKTLSCFWLLMLLALSSEEFGASGETCMPAVTLGCLKDSSCRKPCCNDDSDYSDWRCRDFLCICCRDTFDDPNPKSCSP